MANVDQNGKITAVSAGSAVITAAADGKSDTCAVTVNAAPTADVYTERLQLNLQRHLRLRATNTPTPTPTNTPTPTSSDTPTPTSSTSPTPAPTAAPTESVPETDDNTEDDGQKDTVVVDIDVSDLPEGTHSIQLPNGDIIDIAGQDNIQFEVSKDELDEKGSLELTALNEEGVPLGKVDLQTDESGQIISMPSSARMYGTVYGRYSCGF